MYIRAAELGKASIFVCIGRHYRDGLVVGEDRSKYRLCLEIAAKKGSIHGHRGLSNTETVSGNTETAVKHWRVAARAGCGYSMDNLMIAFRNNMLTKDELAQILRAFQSSRDALKSSDRDGWVRFREASGNPILPGSV